MKFVSVLHRCSFGSFIYLLFLLTVFPLSAEARLSGEAALNYSDYRVSDKYDHHLSGNSFTQDYSLLYDKSGTIYNSRIGRYNVALGYNWSSLDASVKGTNLGPSQNPETTRETRGHLIYSGEIQLDPKELPFKFKAYSRDLTKNSFSSMDTPLISSMFSRNDGMLLGTPNLANGINDGIHIETGATLVAGVKNGMTNGYNEYLRHLPMIMLDYRDRVDKDLRSLTPVDTRLSRLAFVSLNKKDNWFHFRYSTYNDYIDPDNNYKEKQVQIGTVDQIMARRWIDFSNWIQVSTDLQFTKRNNVRYAENFEEVELNLFGQARRTNWEVRSYNYFDRYREATGRLTNSTNLPIYAAGSLNPDLSWRTRTTYKETHDNTGATLETVQAGYQVDALKRSLFTLSHFADVESSSTNDADLLTLSTGLETASSSRFSRKWALAASYHLSDYINKNSLDSTSFYVHRTSLQAGYVPTNQLRVVVRQENEYTHGKNQLFNSTVRDAYTTIPQYDNPNGPSSSLNGSSSVRSLTNVSLMWNPQPRWNYSLTGSEDISAAEDSSKFTVTNLSASVNYYNANVKFNNSLGYNSTDDSINSQTSTLSCRSSLNYQHSRSLGSSLMLSYFSSKQSGISASGYDAEQQLNYSYFSYSGLSRKLFEINEVLQYSNSPTLSDVRYDSANGNLDYNAIITAGTNSNSTFVSSRKRTSRGTLSLGAKYYPLRQLMIAAGGRYLFDSKMENYSLMGYASVAANFRLLQASLDYYQGKRQSDGLMEKKYTANVRKVF